jgi:L-ascorbate metabolism protein UlaG (beta-lactamase superfamily)
MSTAMENYWLKPNICFEPLVSNWYASAHLVSPVTRGLILSKRWLKILKSCIDHPELHQKASTDKKLSGGSFVDLNKHTIADVKALYDDILASNQELTELASAIDQTSLLLEDFANGNSLEQLYSRLPKPLAGCVELVYDMNHRPGIRFIEPLLYHKYANKNTQSILLSLLDSDRRPFILSTPRFSTAGDVHLPLAFDNHAIDLLCRSRYHATPFAELTEALGITENLTATFARLFTQTPPQQYSPANQDEIRIRYFGHACILVETSTISMLIDPVIAYGDDSARFNFFDLPEKIDYVLITHSHQDHFSLETLLQIRHKIKHIVVPQNNTGFLADPGLSYVLQHSGFDSIITLNEMEKITFSEGTITGVPFLGEHGDLNIQSKLAYHIQINQQSFLFAVDSNNLDNHLYTMLAEMLGPLTMLFIGMECVGAPFSWAYGSLFHKPIKRDDDQARRLNGSDAEKAWQVINAFNCLEVVIYAMGKEPWLQHIMGLEYTADSPQLIEANTLLDRCTQHDILAEMPEGKREWVLKKIKDFTNGVANE